MAYKKKNTNSPSSKKLGQPEKFPTDEARKAMFDQLIKHLAEGWDQRHFPACDWDTVERYCDLYPEIFDVKQINDAIRTGKQKWAEDGKAVATGEKQGNGNVMKMFLSNKLGMRDRIDVREVPKSNLSEAGDEELDEIILQAQREIAERNAK